jgi:hypothetical protein
MYDPRVDRSVRLELVLGLQQLHKRLLSLVELAPCADSSPPAGRGSTSG